MQSGTAGGPQFATFYTIPVGRLWVANCNTSVVYHTVITESGTTWGPHFAAVYTIRHGIAGGSPFALRWLRLFLGGVMVHHPWWSAQDTTGMDLNPSPSNSKASSRPRPPLGHPG